MAQTNLSSPPPSIVLSKYLSNISPTCLAAAPQHSARISRNSTFRLQTVFVVPTNVGWPKKAWNQMEQIIGNRCVCLHSPNLKRLHMREVAGCCYGPEIIIKPSISISIEGWEREGTSTCQWWRERDVVWNHWGTWWVCLSRVLNRVFTPK